jgi:hypothetical protein
LRQLGNKLEVKESCAPGFVNGEAIAFLKINFTNDDEDEKPTAEPAYQEGPVYVQLNVQQVDGFSFTIKSLEFGINFGDESGPTGTMENTIYSKDFTGAKDKDDY